MTPVRFDLPIAIGGSLGPESLRLTITEQGVPLDLTGYAAEWNATAVDGTVLFDWKSTDNKLRLNADGTITPNVSAADTAAIPIISPVPGPAVKGVPTVRIGTHRLRLQGTAVGDNPFVQGDVLAVLPI